jgi:hypothetical protein
MWKPHALDCYRSILERPGHWFSKLLIWVANDLSWFELVNWSSNVLMCNRWMCSCMCSHEDTCLCGRINVSKCSPPMRKQFFFSMLSLISSVEKNPSLINYLHKNFFYTWIKTSTSFFLQDWICKSYWKRSFWLDSWCFHLSINAGAPWIGNQ